MALRELVAAEEDGWAYEYLSPELWFGSERPEVRRHYEREGWEVRVDWEHGWVVLRCPLVAPVRAAPLSPARR